MSNNFFNSTIQLQIHKMDGMSRYLFVVCSHFLVNIYYLHLFQGKLHMFYPVLKNCVIQFNRSAFLQVII